MNDNDLEMIEKYYDMCEKATEVQELLALDNKDYPLEEGSYYLPEQYDLQQLLEYTCPAYALLEMIATWGHSHEKQVDTYDFEQLWLAFVMDTKFNKVWDDVKHMWVKRGCLEDENPTTNNNTL